jgi:acetoin utilization protein AcuB
MTRPAISIPPDVSLEKARQIMERRKIRRLPVTKGGKLVGIITRSDINAILGKHRDDPETGKTKVSEVMSPEPATVASSDSLDAVGQAMLEKKISGMPVVDDGRLVGMVTESDLFKALSTMLGFTQKGGRILLTLKPEGDILQQLQRAVGSMTVQGIVTYTEPETKAIEAFVRLRGRKPAKNPR